MNALKPLNWTQKPGIGYTVARRADGGMNLTFTDFSEGTLADWREFALEHLMDSDRLTRNLYDLREVREIPEKAIKMAVEVNSDPSTRNLRVAVLVASEGARQAIMDVAADPANADVIKKVYNWNGLAEAKDAFFDDFRQQLDAAGIKIDELVPTPAPTMEATAEMTPMMTPEATASS